MDNRAYYEFENYRKKETEIMPVGGIAFKTRNSLGRLLGIFGAVVAAGTAFAGGIAVGHLQQPSCPDVEPGTRDASLYANGSACVVGHGVTVRVLLNDHAGGDARKASDAIIGYAQDKIGDLRP